MPGGGVKAIERQPLLRSAAARTEAPEPALVDACTGIPWVNTVVSGPPVRDSTAAGSDQTKVLLPSTSLATRSIRIARLP